MENDRLEPARLAGWDQADAAMDDLVRILVRLVAALEKGGFSRGEALHFAERCMVQLLTN